MQSERCGKPVFDVVIVLDSNDRNAWTIIDDVAQAVDDVLAGRQYQVCGRCDPFSFLSCFCLGMLYDFLARDMDGLP
jgi:hypothetical protein